MKNYKNYDSSSTGRWIDQENNLEVRRKVQVLEQLIRSNTRKNLDAEMIRLHKLLHEDPINSEKVNELLDDMIGFMKLSS